MTISDLNHFTHSSIVCRLAKRYDLKLNVPERPIENRTDYLLIEARFVHGILLISSLMLDSAGCTKVLA